jgi:hypothetical protein
MYPGHTQCKLGFAMRGFQDDFAAQGVAAILPGDFGRCVQTKRKHAPLRVQAAPQWRKCIVGIDYRNAVRRQPLIDLGLRGGDRFHAAEQPDMRRARIRDQRKARAREMGQVTNFARVIHAHFKHRITMARTHSQQREGHTDIVVQIAFGCKHLCLVGARTAQDCGEHLLDRRLAVAACEPDQRQGKSQPPRCSEATQRGACIIDHDQGLCGQTLRNRVTTDDSPGSAPCKSLIEKARRIETLALQCEKKISIG